MQPRSIPKLLLMMCFFVISDLILISSFMHSFFVHSGMNAISIGTALMIKQFGKIILDIPFGILSSRIGLKLTLIISRVFKFASLLLLLYHTKYCFYLSMLFHGFAHSGFYGKYETYIYNYCVNTFPTSQQWKISFRRLVAICYLLQDLGAFSLSLIGGTLFIHGYNWLIYFSIFMAIFYIILGFFLPNINISHKRRGATKTSHICLRRVWADVFVLCKRREVLALVLFLGTINSIAYYMPDLLQVALIELKLNPPRIALISGVPSVVMSVGCIAAIFTKQIYKASTLIWFTFGICFLNLISNTLFYNQLSVLSLVIFLLFYPFVEITLESVIDGLAAQGSRAGITSIVTTFSALLGMLVCFVSGIIANNNCYQISIQVLYLFFCIIIWAIYHLLNNSNAPTL